MSREPCIPSKSCHCEGIWCLIKSSEVPEVWDPSSMHVLRAMGCLCSFQPTEPTGVELTSDENPWVGPGFSMSLLAKDRHFQPGQYLANNRLAWCLQLDPCFLRILPGLPGDMADRMGNPSKGRLPHSSSCKILCSAKGPYCWENG